MKNEILCCMYHITEKAFVPFVPFVPLFFTCKKFIARVCRKEGHMDAIFQKKGKKCWKSAKFLKIWVNSAVFFNDIPVACCSMHINIRYMYLDEKLNFDHHIREHWQKTFVILSGFWLVRGWGCGGRGVEWIH